MISPWLLAAAAGVVAAPLSAPLAEARHAIEVGRLDQARLLIGQAVAAGSRGPAVERALADLAFASGRMSEAAARYAALALGQGRSDVTVVERAGLTALRNADRASAEVFLRKAASMTGASWRSWNALGVLADLSQDFAEADRAYAAALQLAPEQAELANNMGWSLLLRGSWEEAATLLVRAHALDPHSKRIANNLELARTALAEDLPRREPGESDEAWAARLNDAGVAARMRGEQQRAIAAFSQAIALRSSWYRRAAANLERLQASR